MTGRPWVRVAVDGVEASEVSPDLVGLVVRMRRRRPTRLSLSLSSPDDRARPRLPLGAAVDVDLCVEESPDPGSSTTLLGPVTFHGVVVARTLRRPADRPAVVHLAVRDVLHRLCTPPRRRVWRSVTERDLVTAVSAEHGLAAVVDAGGTTYGLVRQVGVSDLAFLQQRARAAGCDLWAVGETVHLGPVTSRSPGSSVLRWGRELVDVRVRTTRTGDRERSRLVARTTGDPRLGVGGVVTTAGVGADVDGREHVVRAVRHTLDGRGGLRTSLLAVGD